MRPLIVILLCLGYAIVGLSAMLPAVDNWFLGDDLAWLAQAKRSRSLWTMMGTTPWDGYFRPTFHALIWLEWRLFQTNAVSYHLVSVLLHSLCGAVLSLLVFLLSRRPWLSLLSGASFLLLAPGAEAVYWISAQNALLAVLLVEASLCLLILSTNHGRITFAVGSILLYILALGSISAAAAALVPLLWFSVRQRRYVMGGILIFLTAGYVAAYTQLSPELSGRILETTPISSPFVQLMRTVVDVYARATEPTSGNAALGIGLAAATSIAGWRMRGVRSLHWVTIIVLCPYLLTLMRHQTSSSTLPFDRYLYVTRPGLAILIAVLVVQLGRAAWKTRAKALAVVPSLVFLLLWAPQQLDASRKMDLLYGSPSTRLRNAVRELQAVDPGTPVRLVLKGFTVPECWLVPKVGAVFLESKLRCNRSDAQTKIHVVRERDGTLRWYQPVVEESTGSSSAPGAATAAEGAVEAAPDYPDTAR